MRVRVRVRVRVRLGVTRFNAWPGLDSRSSCSGPDPARYNEHLADLNNMLWDGKPPTSSWLAQRIAHHRRMAARRKSRAQTVARKLGKLTGGSAAVLASPEGQARRSFLTEAASNLEIWGATSEEQVLKYKEEVEATPDGPRQPPPQPNTNPHPHP